jgi:hypothetical protein
MRTIANTHTHVNTPEKTVISRAQLIQVAQELLQRPIAYHRIFAKIAGGVTVGVMLSQAWYWTNNPSARARGGWFYKSAEEWEEETGLTRREQLTARDKLKKRGLIEEKLAGVPATLHFRVDVEKLFDAMLEQFPEQESSLHKTCKLDSTGRAIQFAQNVQTLTETTPEITSETTHTPRAARDQTRVSVSDQTSQKIGSRYSLADLKAHALAHALGSGWLAKAKTGFYDDVIEFDRERRAQPAQEATAAASRDISACPDCHGSTFKPAPDRAKGVMKCQHDRLAVQPEAGKAAAAA